MVPTTEGALDRLVPLRDESALSIESFRWMYRFWHDARGTAPCPGPEAIDPLRFPPGMLPYLILLAVEASPRRFLVRLAGDAVNEETGVAVAGRYADELPNSQEICERFNWCVDNALPYMVTAPVTWSSRNYRTYSALTLPFGDGPQIARLLQVFHFHPT